jgi:sialate O-acetylesterase
MCFQQLSDVKIWGWDTPGQSITVKPSWTGSSKNLTDNDGNWLVTIKTPKAGGQTKLRSQGRLSI